MKFVEIIKGKEQAFVFQNKRQQIEYVEICEVIWGCIPCDVIWATETAIYKNYLQKLKK